MPSQVPSLSVSPAIRQPTEPDSEERALRDIAALAADSVRYHDVYPGIRPGSPDYALKQRLHDLEILRAR
jgi:hypothetical protein